MVDFTGERIVPQAENCEPRFAEKMYQEHIARYVLAAGYVQGLRVLDVGCGVGYGSRWLLDHGARSVLAFDISEDAIGHAREYYGAEGLEFRVASAADFDFGERFDVVTCFELIEHVDQQQDVVHCIRRALKDDGLLIMSTPRALAEKRTDFHTHEFSEGEFRDLLGGEFESVQLCFENNHFTSLIAEGPPSEIRNILLLQDQFRIADADYFIALARPAASEAHRHPVQPIMVVNDDRYVKLMEHDIQVLHQAEDRLKEELNRLSGREDGMQSGEAEAPGGAGTGHAQGAEHGAASPADGAPMPASPASGQLPPLVLFVGGRLSQAARIARKAVAYRRQHGTAALLRAIRRRLSGGRPAVDVALMAAWDDARTSLETLRGQPLDVLFVIGCWEGESKRYRVHNLVEGLSSLGVIAREIPFAQLDAVVEAKVDPKVVVLFRAPFDPEFGVEKFLAYVRGKGARVVFDIDDLVFDPDILESIDGYKRLPDDQKPSYVNGVHMYRRMMLEADVVTVPTDFLRAHVEALGKPTVVVRNSLNARQFAVAHALHGRPRAAREFVRIGYFSGSSTHQQDFKQCEEALLALMEAHADLILRIVGFLDLDPSWDRFEGRVERLGFVPYPEMLRLLADCDINIAPLDTGSVFCQAKSELKFFEAGLVRVPTVASATDTFQRAISAGVDGYLADNKTQWKNALNALIESPELRARIGSAAHETALQRYSAESVARGALVHYGLSMHGGDSPVADEPSETNPRSLRIAWVIPGLIIGGGGHRNILRAAYFLQQFGHRIELYFIGTERDPAEIKADIQKHFYPLDCPVHLFEGRIAPADVVFATHWSTVQAALTARSVAREIMYFVQDFEPHFAPMGTEYILAENTYRMGLYHITSGPWCEALLRREFNADADHFKFPVDRSIYLPRPRTKSNRNLVYFAKPEMPRRCFELGVMALRDFHRLMPDVEIIMFGSPHLRHQHFDFPVTILDIVPTLDGLAKMYSNADVGLVFSTTNPSLIPYEMMACGLPVVDLRRAGNELNYGGRADIALLADPLPERMAEEIAGLIANREQLEHRRAAGLEFVALFPTEEAMARRIEQLILARIGADIDADKPEHAALMAV